ncbi:cupredoxin domain-containing protein [Bradyrhizobium sp.]|uniref:cupredoxin domain-containing protein n=1 Tax=Bradyrhizobium sp. TaxID=376 RepID=UPI002D2AFEFF|nr:cupredoxin domain-containing protein [Bradyrhizobium sp.]HZR73057.1 cupredoxin domain-containing protein [Bradyrhizobium sp.]
MKRFFVALAYAAFIGLVSSFPAHAQEALTTTIKNHRFDPAEIRVPAGKRVTLTVVNDDASAEEFDSRSLKVEKIIAGRSKAMVSFGPLKPGRYEFEGEFNSKTAKGVVIAE